MFELFLLIYKWFLLFMCNKKHKLTMIYANIHCIYELLPEVLFSQMQGGNSVGSSGEGLLSSRLNNVPCPLHEGKPSTLISFIM